MSVKIAMIGAGSRGFSLGIARELLQSDYFKDARFVLMDIAPDRLDESYNRIMKLCSDKNSPIILEKTLDQKCALNLPYFVRL